MLRHYPADSPEAAARIVALALLCDGHPSHAELARLDALAAAARLGLTEARWQVVLHDLCEDLLACTDLAWTGHAPVDPALMSQLLADIGDPGLRATVLELCVAAAEADECISDGEEALLVAAVEQWGLQARMMARPPA